MLKRIDRLIQVNQSTDEERVLSINIIGEANATNRNTPQRLIQTPQRNRLNQTPQRYQVNQTPQRNHLDISNDLNNRTLVNDIYIQDM